MAHFAEIDESNVVLRVIVAEQDIIDSGNVGDPSKWVQTSYNTRDGKHYDPVTGEEDDGTPLRYRYAGIGMIYDPDADIFHFAQPYPSWTFNNTTYDWHPPAPYPKDTGDDDDITYYWDEENKEWADNETAPSGEGRDEKIIPGWNYE